MYDLCVHPEAAALAQGDERLRLTLMDIATEMIGKCEGRGPGEQNGWRILDGKRSGDGGRDGMPVVGGVDVRVKKVATALMARRTIMQRTPLHKAGFRVLKHKHYMASTPNASPPSMLITRAALAPGAEADASAAASASTPSQQAAPPQSAAPCPLQSAPLPQGPQKPRYTLTERMGGHGTGTEPLLSAVPAALAAGSMRRRGGPQRWRPDALVLRVQLPGVVRGFGRVRAGV